MGYLVEMAPGDNIVAFLKDRRLGAWGRVVASHDPKVFEPQFTWPEGDREFGRVVRVAWDDSTSPPPTMAARMKPDDTRGFSSQSTINRLSDEAFDRLKAILADHSRWEPIAELAEEKLVDDQPDLMGDHDWVPPLRESALRRILARDLSLVEPGLKPFDPERGAEDYSIEVGRMDLFCRDRDDNPVVIELKRDDACDAVVGQLARYMGYVGEHHLPPGGRVRGIIISHDVDETLRYAIKAVAGAELLTYEVEVRVHKFQTAS
jgi:hypothetical protein